MGACDHLGSLYSRSWSECEGSCWLYVRDSASEGRSFDGYQALAVSIGYGANLATINNAAEQTCAKNEFFEGADNEAALFCRIGLRYNHSATVRKLLRMLARTITNA